MIRYDAPTPQLYYFTFPGEFQTRIPDNEFRLPLISTGTYELTLRGSTSLLDQSGPETRESRSLSEVESIDFMTMTTGGLVNVREHGETKIVKCLGVGVNAGGQKDFHL
jgi:hypothetical protein